MAFPWSKTHRSKQPSHSSLSFATGGYLLEVPAGKLDPGEAPEMCAARELEEETGYRAARVQKLGAIPSDPYLRTQWQASRGQVTEYFDHLRDLAQGTASTIVERMRAAGVETRSDLQAKLLRDPTVYAHGCDGAVGNPLGVPMISNWSRVTGAIPDIFERLIDAVERDHEWDPIGDRV